jgi:hypothetical protein
MKTISIYCAQYNEGDTMTLAQLAQEVEAQERESLKTGSFESFGDFLSYFDMHYRPMLERIENGEDISESDRHLLNFLASDLLDIFKEGSDKSEEEDEEEEDPTLTEAEKRDTLCRLWDAAWQQAQADPEGTRVIVETNEEDPSANCNPYGRYYMVDGSESESCIEHAGQWVVIRVDTVTSPYEVHRPNFAAAHGYSDNQTQLACRCENPNNVTRWARKMIDAGRVTDIYADCY